MVAILLQVLAVVCGAVLALSILLERRIGQRELVGINAVMVASLIGAALLNWSNRSDLASELRNLRSDILNTLAPLVDRNDGQPASVLAKTAEKLARQDLRIAELEHGEISHPLSNIDFDRLSASLHSLGPLKVRIGYRSGDDELRAFANGLYLAFVRGGWSPVLPQPWDFAFRGDAGSVALSDRISPVLAYQLANAMTAAGISVNSTRLTKADANAVEIYVGAKLRP
jgi:hypothetical protein